MSSPSAFYWSGRQFGQVIRRDDGETVMLVGYGKFAPHARAIMLSPPKDYDFFLVSPGDLLPDYPYLVSEWTAVDG